MSGVLVRVIGPLVRGSTYRAGVHLLLGCVLLLPYLGLGALFAQSFQVDAAARSGLALLLLVAVVVSVTIALLPAVRVLEVAAARSLLGAAVPEQTVEGSRGWEARWRAAGWLGVNLVLGGAAVLATLFALPTSTRLFLVPVTGLEPVPLGGITVRLGPGWGAWWVPLVGVGLLIVLCYLVAALGALLRRLAPVLLGPSPAERVAELERQTQRLAERNRLARELHDSVGHALTVTTLQAGAARQVLDADPDFARSALASIEEVGRTALDDLDHVLGLLRDENRDTSPQRSLDELEQLLGEARATGVVVTLERSGGTASVPPAVSREAYRIVQEGLTNALRHAGPVPVSLRLDADADRLELEMANPLGERDHAVGSAGGRGLAGIQERVTVLRGQLRAGAENGLWRMAVRLPLRSHHDRAGGARR